MLEMLIAWFVLACIVGCVIAPLINTKGPEEQ